jgi:peptidoglycan/LPS O-acetylase OafA/YrhL
MGTAHDWMWIIVIAALAGGFTFWERNAPGYDSTLPKSTAEWFGFVCFMIFVGIVVIFPWHQLLHPPLELVITLLFAISLILSARARGLRRRLSRETQA